MSNLAEAARTAELAFTNMGQAADALAEALRQAVAEARRLETERDQLALALLLLALKMRAQRERRGKPYSSRLPIDRKRAVRAYFDPFQRWLRERRGFSKSSTRVYRDLLCAAMNRFGIDVGDLACLSEEQLQQAHVRERNAIRHWRAFLAERNVG